MRSDFQNGISVASELIQEHTYPLLVVSENFYPDIVASCIFLEVNKSAYLVSAAHAVRANATGLLTRGNGQLIDVVGRTTISHAETKDHFDIAAIRIDENTIREHDIKVISENMCITSVEVENPHSRAVCGFPVSMNKQSKVVDRKAKSMTAKCFSFFGFAEFRGEFQDFKKSPDTHVGIEFGAGKDESGRYLSNPPYPPRGISGGGAWLIPDLSRPNLVFLEGIFIEAYKHEKKMYGFSTKLEHVISFIYQTQVNKGSDPFYTKAC